MCVYLCVCPLLRALTTSGIIWCDIDCVILVKQLLTAFLLITMTIAIDKTDGHGLTTQHIVNTSQEA